MNPPPPPLSARDNRDCSAHEFCVIEEQQVYSAVHSDFPCPDPGLGLSCLPVMALHNILKPFLAHQVQGGAEAM